ncbi:MAG: Nif3-like dinuclear metal center hexameric protein [Verrucomicrobiota bacterium]
MFKPANLESIVSYCEKKLRHSEINDWPRAKNGLQVTNNGKVTRIAASVDSHLGVIEQAAEQGIDLLLVHHGLFWNELTPIKETSYTKLKLLFDHNIALFSSHLPLDLHPQLGNNACIAKLLGLKYKKPFGEAKGELAGFHGIMDTTRDDLLGNLTKIFGKKPNLLPGGKDTVQRVGIVSGGAADNLFEASALDLDAFITGEGAHWTYGAAMEAGLNVYYGGHYLTETFGVKALADHLSKKYNIPWEFIDLPSGL